MVHCLGKLTLITYLRILVENFYLAATMRSKNVKFIRNFMSFLQWWADFRKSFSIKPPMSKYIIWNNKDIKIINQFTILIMLKLEYYSATICNLIKIIFNLTTMQEVLE